MPYNQLLYSKYFYPRSPCGERPIPAVYPGRYLYFYPRSPCGERLALRWPLVDFTAISIHALLAESDPAVSAVKAIISAYFYPRSPCGERQIDPNEISASLSISIHALLAESDYTPEHLLHSLLSFLSTLSLRRATVPVAPWHRDAAYFYPRSPCGERPVGVEIDNTDYWTFLSTLSLRRATMACCIICDRPNISIHALLAESDACVACLALLPDISIHALLAESDCWVR